MTSRCAKTKLDRPCLPSFYFLFLLTIPSHKFFHAMESFLDLAVFGCITGPRKPAATGTEGVTRHHRDVLFEQQLFSEDFIIHTRGLDVGKRVERATRLEGPQT